MLSLLSVLILSVASGLAGTVRAEQADHGSNSQQIEVHAVAVDEPTPGAAPQSGEIWDAVRSTCQSPAATEPAPPKEDSANEILMTVTSTARIRAEPSLLGETIGIAPARVTVAPVARVADWVLILDPWSWEMGWIHSKLLAPLTIEVADQDTDIRVSSATPSD
jgi:hypothetical protein